MRAGSGVQKFEPCSGAQGADSCTHSSFSHLTNNRPASTVADSYLPDGDLPRSRGKGSAPVPVTSVFSSKHPASCPLGALVPVRLPRGGCPPPPSPSPPGSHLGVSLGRLWASCPPSSTGPRVASSPVVLSPGLRPGGLSDPGGLATSHELSEGRSPWTLPPPPNLPPHVGFRSAHPGPVTSTPLVRIDTAHIYTC